MYTDGLFEATNPDLEEFGQDRLLDTFRAHAGEPPGDLLDAALATVSTFTGRRTFEDDICLVGVDRTQG
jgi:sigma-B regulation protein RsbU (phosphoserine phosphatase)